MRRKLVIFALLLLSAPAVLAQIGGGIFGPPTPNPPQEFTVCPSGCDFAQACGMRVGGATGFSCGDPDDQCVSNSAVSNAKAKRVADPNTPVIVRVLPGTYNECIAIDNTSGFTLHVEEGATVHPRSTNQADVDGGAIRVANLTAAADSTTDITIIVDGVVRNDDYFTQQASTPAVEAAIQVGLQNSTANNNWNRVTIQGTGTIIANHIGVAYTGSGLTTDTSIPLIDVVAPNIKAGSVGIQQTQGFADVRITSPTIKIQQNGCESADPNITGTVTGTLDPNSQLTTLIFDSAAATTDHIYTNRTVVVSGDNCATASGATNNVAAIGRYTGATRRAFITSSLTADPNACTYEILPVANSGGTNAVVNSSPPFCSDVDWTVLRAPRIDSFWGVGRAVGILINGAGGATIPTGTSVVITDPTISVDVNEVGAIFVHGCNLVTGQNEGNGIAGIQIGTAPVGDVIVDGLDLNLRVNYPSGQALDCAPLGAVIQNARVHGRVSVSGRALIQNTGSGLQDIGCVSLMVPNATNTKIDVDGLTCEFATMPSSRSTLAAGAAGTVTLNASEPTTTTIYDNQWIHLLTGTCAGQRRFIFNYTAGRVASVTPNWDGCTPGAGDSYRIGIIGPDISASPPLGTESGNIFAVTTTAGGSATANIGSLETFGADTLYQSDGVSHPNGWSSIASLGNKVPNWSQNSAAWAAGDLVCTEITPPRGTTVLDTASITVQTGLAASLSSVCLYTYDGRYQIGVAESISTATGGVKTGAFANKSTGEAAALGMDHYWLCIGSDATATLLLKGAPAMTLGTGVVGRLGTGAATCPDTIAPASMTAWTTVIPEAVLTQ